MYLRHFGLDKPLFDDGIARDSAVFIGDAERDALGHAALALTSRDSILVLSGPPGIGKTTFAAAAVGAASDSSRIAAAWLGSPALSPFEMLELLLLEFGFDPYQQTRVERLQTWRQFLTEMTATDTRIFIAVEHADDLDSGVLKALASLTAADPSGCPGANLILMGQPSLTARLSSPDLAELKQRVRLTRRFLPFDDAAVEGYLKHCVDTAGGDFDAVFGAGAVTALRVHTGGIPRAINHVCDTALGLAAARGAARVTANFVRSAAVEVCGLADPETTDAGADASPHDTDQLPHDTDQSPYDNDEPPYDNDQPPYGPDDIPLDDIPVLTDTVDVDVDDPAPLASVPRAAASHADAALDDLSAELVDAILSGDGPAAGVEPTYAPNGHRQHAGHDTAPPVRLRATA
jgi:general secretion pathway protein A